MVNADFHCGRCTLVMLKLSLGDVSGGWIVMMTSETDFG
jgi:hypothetical protein